MLRLLVSAGGTAGGVYPALAVIEKLPERAEVLWVGGEGGMEATLVKRSGIPFEAIPAAGIHGVGLRRLPGNLVKLLRGVAAASNVIRSFKPDVIFVTGGYVGVPVAIAGLRVPKAVYIPDIEPGLALRILHRLADFVAVTLEETRQYLRSKAKVVVTGYPLRAALHDLDAAEARKRLGLEPTKPVMLVLGGSRGARSINHALWRGLPDLLIHAQILHLTGERDWPLVEEVRAKLPAHLAKDFHPHAYLHEEMASALASADFAVSRAGAASLGEYPLFGLPAVLVPYPHAGQYQRVNADYLTSKGAAVQIQDDQLEEQLLPTLLALLKDPTRLSEMSSAMQALAVPDAASRIAEHLEQLAKARKGAHG